jgi:hypothetical protein
MSDVVKPGDVDRAHDAKLRVGAMLQMLITRGEESKSDKGKIRFTVVGVQVVGRVASRTMVNHEQTVLTKSQS